MIMSILPSRDSFSLEVMNAFCEAFGFMNENVARDYYVGRFSSLKSFIDYIIADENECEQCEVSDLKEFYDEKGNLNYERVWEELYSEYYRFSNGIGFAIVY